MKLLIHFIIAFTFSTQSAFAGQPLKKKQWVGKVISQIQSDQIVQNLEALARAELTQMDFAHFQKQKPTIQKYAKVFSKMKVTQNAQSVILNIEGVQPVEISWARESEGIVAINQQPIHFTELSYIDFSKKVSDILDSKLSWHQLLIPEAHAGGYIILAVVAVVALGAISMLNSSGKNRLIALEEKFSSIHQACEKRDPKQSYSDSETARLFNELVNYDKNKDLFLESKEANKQIGSSCTTYFTGGRYLGKPDLINAACTRMNQMLICVQKYQAESIKKHGESSVSEAAAKAAQ